MEEDFNYLHVDVSDRKILAHLSEMGEMLKKLKTEQLAAEEAAANAKAKYERYANVVIPSEMHACGIDCITLQSGGQLKLKHNFYCQPNKNAEDRKKIVEWLRAHNGSHIVEHDATVSADDMSKLDKNGIPFIENTSVNTQKLKSFLKDGIGATTGVQQFTIDDIPACIHFQEVTTVDISL